MTMPFIYHGVPESMAGYELMPLNLMRQTLPDLYARYAAKYTGREEIMQRRIPLLDCLWNDVIQFLPLHPRTVFELQQELGLIPEVPPYKFFEIDLAALDPNKTVVYFKTAPGEENISIKWLHDVDFASLQTIPAATRAYYETLVGTGELPFNYQFIPHILYAGTVDISTAKIITL